MEPRLALMDKASCAKQRLLRPCEVVGKVRLLVRETSKTVEMSHPVFYTALEVDVEKHTRRMALQHIQIYRIVHILNKTDIKTATQATLDMVRKAEETALEGPEVASTSLEAVT